MLKRRNRMKRRSGETPRTRGERKRGEGWKRGGGMIVGLWMIDVETLMIDVGMMIGDDQRMRDDGPGRGMIREDIDLELGQG